MQRKFRETLVKSTQLACRATIYRSHSKVMDTGELGDALRSGRCRSFDDIEHVNAYIGEKPDMLVRVRVRRLNLSRSPLHRMLKEDLKLHPYKARLLHELAEEDFAHRVAFCEEMQKRLDNDPDFNVFFTDEAHFHLSSDVNRHNLRYWSNENPNIIISKPLHSPCITVWASV